MTVLSVKVRLDRVGIMSWAGPGWKPPKLPGFKVEYDHFIHTPGSMYSRARSLRSLTTGTRIAWQYYRRKSFVDHWRVVMNGDDDRGISPTELRQVLDKCRFYRFTLVELAIDFAEAYA